jgi:hypothetical protein
MAGCAFSILLFQRCASNDQPGYWANGKIAADKRADFHKMNDEVIKELMAKDSKSLESMLSKQLLDNYLVLRKEEIIGNTLNKEHFILTDEYYAVNFYKTEDTIVVKNRGINNYSLRYPGVAREMYFAMFVPKTGPEKDMITLAYAKFSYGWKIYDLYKSPYTNNGKTAPELFDLAYKMLARNYLMDAKTNLDLANNCINPNPFFHYKNEALITAENDVIRQFTYRKYHIPGTVNGVATRPLVISLTTKSTDEGTFPVIYYMTKIKLSDTAAIKKENEQVKRAIGKIVPGIDKDKKYVFYTIFNGYPNMKKMVNRYEITDQLQKN